MVLYVRTASRYFNKCTINLVVIADERDNQSPGMVLAQQYNAKKVPFFLMDDHTGVTMIDVYSDFKERLKATA